MNARLYASSILLAACMTAAAEDPIKDDTYNMPPAVVAEMGVDAAMKKMETPVTAETLDAFKKAHPAPFWLFGEDRQLAVRNNIVPAHWFQDGAKQFQKFSGVARPGEFYVLQVGLIPGDIMRPLDCGVVFDSLQGAQATVISGEDYSMSQKGERRLPYEADKLFSDPVKPIWIGLQIPENATPGTYAGRVQFRTTRFRSGIDPIIGGDDHALFVEHLAFSIKVQGEPLKESGTGEAWRLARLKWLDSKIGESDTEVTRPFTSIRVGAATRTLGILGRTITLGESGIPAQFTSFFSESNTRILDKGRDAFASAPSFEVVIGGKPVKLKPSVFNFTKQTPVGVEWEAVNSTPDLSLLVKGRLEFDGNLRLAMTLTSESKTNAAWIEGVPVDDVRFIVPFAKGVTKYAMGLGLQGGLAPEKLDWKWDTRKNQDALWLGDANIGTMLRFKGGNYRRPLINAYYAFQPLNLPESWGGGGIRIANDADHAAMLTAYSGPKKVTTLGKGEGGLHFDIDFYLTPFKPLDVKQHFTDRYYHAKQGASNEDTAKLHADGANILEVHHNRPCNPYINYPFNDDSFGSLKDFIGKAHADDMRVGVYYTNRELTQNLPEFFALKSLDGEVILKRKEGVAWPVTNSGGPHPWLKQHVGEDIVPAWRENLKFPQYKSSLDLAVITTPDSRWNNFYLEGLDYLVKKAGIDGLYIDDTALDRKSMQRARRILDADGNTGRRVNMHSWNHFNGLAAWANSSIAFMELYPYYNGLWHGESFNADASPEFMLVEISGIPYGLMSEMLDHPNPWHGMVFGMRTRWPWSGDPREQWKFEESFGIADSEFIGWWDANNPIKVDKTDPADPARVIASVYKKQGKTLVALGNWGKATKIKLTADWKALGLDAGKVKLHAPEIKGFQPEQTFAPGDEISVEASRGWMLIVE